MLRKSCLIIPADSPRKENQTPLTGPCEPPHILVVFENVPGDANAREYVTSLDAKFQAK